MTEEETNNAEEAIILPADNYLQRKLGDIDLDKVLSDEAIKNAELVIADASSELYQECLEGSEHLQVAVGRLGKSGKSIDFELSKIASDAFAIKSKAAQCGYDLVSEIAKSLNNLCEEMNEGQAKTSGLKLIPWHAQSIWQLLDQNIKGDGGPMGKAILAEIERFKLSA